LDFDKNKKLKLKINGKIAEVEVKDQSDLLLATMGFSSSTGSKTEEIKAPMPGLIIDIKVFEGDQVKAGDPLMVLEAMKMENILKSPTDGKIAQILAKKGEIVEKNRVLIKFGL
jgi:biotin carboxyl carrier protein